MSSSLLSPSSSARKSIMWNIVDPGDPYDIKKSMIAKMPGDDQNFLGDHLQMICLLQAAEIQRISQYLEEYKLRYRQLQRKQLDRHSYEVQIKQLIVRLAQSGNLKIENSKLKDFILKQSSQMQDLKREIYQNRSDSILQDKYQSCLLQLQAVTREVNILRESKIVMSSQIEQYIAKISAIQSAKNRELQQLRMQLFENNKFAFESEKRQLTLKFESQISRLEYQNRKYREELESKRFQIEQLNIRIVKIGQRSNTFSYNEQRITQQMNRKVAEYQSRFAIMGQQLERPNVIINNKSNQAGEISSRFRDLQYQLQRKDSLVKEYEFKMQKYQKEINILNISIRDYKIQSESSRNNVYYEQRINNLNAEIDRINITVRQKVQQITILSRRVQEYEYQIRNIEIIRRQNEEYKRQSGQYIELRRRLGEYENKMSSFKLQIERLTSILSNKDHQITTYDSRSKLLQKELENYKKRITEFESTISNQMKIRISTYQQKYTFNQQNVQYENRIGLMRQEIERLNQFAKLKSQQTVNYENHIKSLKYEIQNYRNRIHEVQGTLSIDMQNKVTSFEQKIYIFNQQNEELRRKVNYLNQTNMKLSQDLQKYQVSYRTVQQQLQGSRRRYQEFQTSISHQWQTKMVMYQQKISIFVQQNEQIKRRLFQMTQINKILPQYENKMALLSQQIDRLTLRIRQRESQLQNWRKRYVQLQNSKGHQMSTKFSSYQQRITVITKEVEVYRRKIAEYESRIAISSQEIERLNQNLVVLENRNRSLQQELQHSKRRFGDTEREIIQEWQTKISSYESRIISFTQQNQQLGRRFHQSESRFAMANQQIERLNQIIRVKSEQFVSTQIRIRNLQQQLQAMKQRFIQAQSSTSHQFSSKITIFQQRITSISQQNESLKRRLQEMGDLGRRVVEYQSKIAILSQQLERFSQIIKLKVSNSLVSSIKTDKYSKNCSMREGELSSFNFQGQTLQDSGKFRYPTSKRESQYLQDRTTILKEQLVSLKGNENLNQGLRIKTDELNNLGRKHHQEVQSLRRIISQTETSMSQEWHSKVTFFQQKIQGFSRQNIQLEKRLRQVLEINRSIPEYQNKMQSYLREIQRLNIQIQKFGKENSSLNQRVSQLDLLRQRLVTSETQYNRIQGQHSTIIQQLHEVRSRLTLISKQNQGLKQQIRYLSQDSGKKGVSLSQEIQRLNIVIRNKVQQYNSMELNIRTLKNELQNSRRRIVQIQSSVSSQWHTKVNVFQQKISIFSRENDDLKRRLAEGQNKIVIQLQQIERLNQVIKVKVDQLKLVQGRYQQQIVTYKRRITQVESSMSHQWTTKVSFFESTIVNLNREIQQLKRRFNQANERLSRTTSQYQNKIAILTQQIERLNFTLRNKSEQTSNSDMRVRKLQQELQEMRRKVSQQQTSIYSEWQTKVSMYQQKISIYINQNDQFKRRIAEYQNKIAILSQEIERLTMGIRTKNQQLVYLQTTYNQLKFRFESYEVRGRNQGEQYQRLYEAYNLISQEYEKSKRHIVEYETSIKRLHIQFERLQVYVNQIKQENSVLRRQLQEGNIWSEKNKILSVQINRLTQLTEQQKTDLEQVRMRLSDDIALQKRINQHMALMVVLFAEIESLRRRVQDKEKQCQEVRRSSLAPFKSL